MIRLGVDVGGTFTDLAALGRTRRDRQGAVDAGRPVAGVMRSLDAVGPRRGRLDAFAHGMTVATNALLERRGAPHRADHHRGLPRRARDRRARPAPTSTTSPSAGPSRSCRATCASPCASAGPGRRARAARRGQRRRGGRGAARVRRRGGRRLPAVRASCTPTHERRVGEALREALCRTSTSRSRSEVLPEFREYERFATTVADAYLAPQLGRLPASACGERGGGRACRRRW